MNRAFFGKDALAVAERLIGCYIVRRWGGEELIVRLTETEAYLGSEDPASHAWRGVTPRNAVMFGEPGRLYVYLSYGIHSCINIVTNQEGEPGAVLLRGAIPVAGTETIRKLRSGVPDKQLLNGPGKLAQGLGVTLDLNGYDLLSTQLRQFEVLEGEALPCTRTPRIGISRGQDLLWRFIAKSPQAAL